MEGGSSCGLNGVPSGDSWGLGDVVRVPLEDRLRSDFFLTDAMASIHLQRTMEQHLFCFRQ